MADEQRVWIAQCLCPERHAIFAASGEADSESAAAEALTEPLREAVERMLRSGAINPWCGLCSARPATWRYELGRTRWRTMEEAEPILKQLAAGQAVARLLFGDP
jgi:hypothetical protein